MRREPTGMDDAAGARYRPRLSFDGPDGAPCLVLGHALGAGAGLWDDQVRALGAGIRIVRFNAPGHGGAPDAHCPGLPALAQALLLALDAARVDHFFYGGVAMGGALGLALARLAPQRLRGLVLSNTASQFGPAALWNQRIAQAEAEGLQALADAALSRWVTPEQADAEPATGKRLLAMFRATSRQGHVQACQAVRDFDARPDLGAITVPTLVIAGRHDLATTPAQALELHHAIAGSRHLELPAAHLANIGCPDRFNAALAGFVATTLSE